MSSSIGVIGDKNSVMVFKLVGFDVYYADDCQTARETISQLAESDYGILYVTENYFKQLSNVIMQYNAMIQPAIICIPTFEGSEGYGKKQLEKFVEKAVGQNIL